MKKLYTLIICIFFFANLPAQNAGDLDLDYGTDGISIIPFLYQNSISDISIMSDNRIVSGGSYHSTGDNLLSFKFNTNGSLAPYNAATWFEYDFDDYENITATFVLPDDKVLLAGWYGLVSKSYFVICLMPDGYPDPSFGTSGILTDNVDFIPMGIDAYYGLSGDYSIFLAGNMNGSTTPAILKVNQNGTVTTAFGTNGFYEFNTYAGGYTDIYVHSFAGIGSIYACGNKDLDNISFITKHDIGTGELITDFSTDGIYAFSISGGSMTYAVSLVYTSSITNSKITVFGDYVHPDLDTDVFALRLNASDGNPDTGFGVNGFSKIRLATSNEYIHDALAQAGGKYYFGGSSNMMVEEDFFLGRLNADGTLDLTFGVNGVVVTDIQGEDHIAGLALNQDQTRIYGGGVSSNENTDRAATIACYYTDFGVGIDDSEDQELLSVEAFPNPATDLINIVMSTAGKYDIEIIDLTGKIVMKQVMNAEQEQIDITHLQSGMYFLRASDDQNHSSTHKIIKK